MFSPCLSDLLVSEVLFIYIVKFVKSTSTKVRVVQWWFLFFLYGRSLQNNEISNISEISFFLN